MDLKKYAIQSEKSILSWDEALPLGNGKLGCLIYGKGPLRFALDRVDLWDLRENDKTTSAEYTYENLVKLSLGDETDWEKREDIFESNNKTPYPTKFTAGALELDFGLEDNNAKSHLDIQTAVADVQFGKAKAQSFTSATRFLGVIKVKGCYTLSLKQRDYLQRILGYHKAQEYKEDGFTYFVQKTTEGFSYGVFVLEKKRGLVTEIYYTIETSKDAKDFVALAKEKLLNACKTGYNALKKEHIAWWKNYWQKSSISIENELLEKTYYRSYYLFASCSRKGFYPMPLQGVWTADIDDLPPWRGDYHHDTNTQLSYQSYLKANRLEEGEVFIDYIWSLVDEYKDFAKRFFGVDGLIIPGCTTLDGKPMSGWVQYALSPTMTIWVAQSFDEYYLYTGDEKFLTEKAYPFFEEVGKAFEGILKEKDGKLYLPLSSSPEIFDATKKAYLPPNSNFDLALIRYLFTTLVRYCKILQKDGGRYENILSKLDDIAVIKKFNKYDWKEIDVIALDKTQALEESHRHFSHLMCLYPLHLINYDTDEHKTLYHNAIFELERLGKGWWAGFSFVMCAQIYAMAEKGNATVKMLEEFADGFVGDNGFHLNGDFKNKGYSVFHYRPFTLESSFGFCDALQEALLQDHQGYIHLFPAIASEWKNTSFHSFRSCQGILVSAKKTGDTITEFSLSKNGVCRVKIKNTFGKERLYFSNGLTVDCAKGDIFEIEFENFVRLVK